jgi:hypothetical protein
VKRQKSTRGVSRILRTVLILAATLLPLVAGVGCGPSLPPINLHLERPVVPPEPVKHAKVIKDPATGTPGIFISEADMKADLKWKAEAKGEIQKGQINTDKANEAFKSLEKWVK